MRQRDFSPRSRGGHRRRPGLPVVVGVPRAGMTTQPEDCLPLRVPGSGEGQLRSVWRALDGVPQRPAGAPWPADPARPGGPAADPPGPERWPADPSAPAPSTADSVWEARLADLLGW